MDQPICFTISDKIKDAIDTVLSRSSINIEDKQELIECKNKNAIPLACIQKLSKHLTNLESNGVNIQSKWVHEILEGSSFAFPKVETEEPVRKYTFVLVRN